MKEYLERNSEKHKDKVFYVTDEKQQAQYIRLFREHDMEAVLMQSMIDNHFIQFMEMKDSNIKFSRIDADISENLIDTSGEDKGKTEEWQESLEKIFKEALGMEQLRLKVENLKTDTVPAMILLSEQSRRMREMSKMFGGGMDMSSMFPREETLVLNRGNNLIKSLFELKDKVDRQDDVKMICQHIYDLAMISHTQLEPDAMTRFIERSNQILQKVTGL